MKKMILLLMVVVCIGVSVSVPLPVKASETAQETEISELNQVMTAKDQLDVKETPDDNAATVMTFESGDAVFVAGETTDGWYKVSYQDKAGYVRKSELATFEMDVEGIDKEMTEAAEEGKQVVEEVERYRTEARRTKIWGTVIVLLVVGIFATGIISTMKNEREEGKETSANKVARRKHKVVKLQTKVTVKPVNIVEEKKDIGRNTKKWDSFSNTDKEEWDAFEYADREAWDLLVYSDKEEWDLVVNTDKEEWDSFKYPDGEKWN